MNNPTNVGFGNGRYSKETEGLYNQFQKLFGISEPVAKLIASHLGSDAGRLAKEYFGRPSIRYLATNEPISSYAMAVVKACASVEKAPENGISAETQFELPEILKQWISSIETALSQNDGGVMARKKACAGVIKCPGCQEWMFEGRIIHRESCPAKQWEEVKIGQRKQGAQKQQEEFRNNAEIATAKMKARLGPTINATTSKKAKAKPQAAWPPIVSGGAVESNRKKF